MVTTHFTGVRRAIWVKGVRMLYRYYKRVRFMDQAWQGGSWPGEGVRACGARQHGAEAEWVRTGLVVKGGGGIWLLLLGDTWS